jgi:phosphoglycerate dehydrogenase-like enzyme
MRKVLVIAADQERFGAGASAHTFKPGHEAKLKRTVGKRIQLVVATPEEAKKHLADAEVVAAFPMRMPDISLMPQVKWLHSFSAGVDKILSPKVAQSKVILTNSSGVHATPIAETILAYCLMFARGFIDTIREQRQKQWNKNYNSAELRDSTMLVVGLGAIGMETARIANAFGMHVIATARTKKKKPAFIARFETSEKLDDFLPLADYIIITLPHTKDTHHLFDKQKFALMKKSAVVINIGRGGIIKESDLIEALRQKSIAGAGLDVFEKEPLPADSPLWDMPNVIITPHHSGLSLRYMDRAVDVFCENLKAYLKGESLPNKVDKILGY